MTQEEKAKAYDKAFEIIKAYYNRTQFSSISDSREEIKTIEKAFPELKESEDDRIRKAIKYGLDHVFTNNTTIFEVTKEQCLAWLEKQGKQKLINPTLEEKDKMDDDFTKMMLKDEQKIAKWSEEDEKMLSDIIKDLVHPWNEYIPDRIEDEIKWLKNWLKSIRPQSTWKPSDEQMVALQEAMNIVGILTITGSKINSLYQDLKKLKG